MATNPTQTRYTYLTTWNPSSARKSRWNSRLPYLTILCGILTIVGFSLDLGAGHNAKGNSGEGVVHRGVIDERLKILSFTAHYPTTFPNQERRTSYLISWYFSSACVRPANDSANAVCLDRTVYQPFNMTSFLLEIDDLNGLEMGVNVSSKMPSFETLALKNALPRPNTVVPFFVLIGVILLQIPVFLLVIGRRSKLKLAFLLMAISFAAGLVGAVWVTSVAYTTKRTIDKLDSSQVREAKIGVSFMGLLWMGVVTSLFGMISTGAHVFVWAGMSEEQRRVDTEKRVRREEEWREARRRSAGS